MLIFNNLPTVFPWYDKLEKQARYRENVEKVCDYKLITPSNALLPFQFRRESSASAPVSWTINNANTAAVVRNVTDSITLPLGAGYLKAKTLDDWDYFYYNGQKLLESGIEVLPLDYGFYYSVITFSDGTQFFSEVFHVPEPSFTVGTGPDDQTPVANMRYLRLMFWNGCDVKPLFYNDISGGFPVFRQILYLDTFVHASEPELTIDSVKDGNDTPIPTFQRAAIRYRITDLLPDYLKLALALLPLHEKATLKTPQGIHTGDIERVTVTSEIEPGGAYSTVNIIFEQDLAAVKVGCCDNMLAQACDLDTPTLTEATIPDPLHLMGTAGGATYLIFYVSITEGGPYVPIGYVSAEELESVEGFNTPMTPTLTANNWVKVKGFTFNCESAFSNALQYQ